MYLLYQARLTSHFRTSRAAKSSHSPIAIPNHYQHGTGTAELLVCARCGVFPLVLCSIDDKLYAITNINTCQYLDKFTQAPKFVDYDGEKEQQRLAQRKNSGIPQVTVSPTT